MGSCDLEKSFYLHMRSINVNSSLINIQSFGVLQLVSMQREFQKQMGTILAVPIAKEVKKMEVALGQRMEKALKAHADALWARLQEENLKREKLEKDRVQQLTTMLTSVISKDMPGALERAVKKELSSIGSHVTRLVIPSIEKAVSTAVNDSFQVCSQRNSLNYLGRSYIFFYLGPLHSFFLHLLLTLLTF